MDASFASNETISDDQDPEESGWTSYFDDFFSNQKQEQYSGGSDDDNILVSDAASFVLDPEKFCKTDKITPSTSIMPKFSKELDMKKPSTDKMLLYEDSLHDTASSPVNSPRIVQEAQAIPEGLNFLETGGSEKRAVELLWKER